MPSYTSVHLAERPKDRIVPGQTFTMKEHPIPDSINNGEVLLKVLYLSIDPAMRRWVNQEKSSTPLVEIGGVMRSSGIGIVTTSKSASFPVGTYASGMCGWTEYAVMKEQDLEKLDCPEGTVLTDELSILGTTSLTAYFGILDIGKVKKGDFVVVSGAAGAVGSVVGQIAKIKGATVLGLAGADDKVRWLKEELGFDVALNYKDPDFVAKFTDATKDSIDVYFDTVGGEILDLALSRAKPHSVVVMCGATSEYNRVESRGLKNYLMIVIMRITMRGFTVLDYTDQYPEAKKQLVHWLLEGKLRRKETVLRGGPAKAEQALIDLLDGKHTGKSIIEILKTEEVRAVG